RRLKLLDRLGKAIACSIDEVAREPVRVAVRVRRDRDAVGVEQLERVFDREQRIGVRDKSLGVDTRGSEGAEAEREALFCMPPRTPVVARPEPESRVEGGGDYEDLSIPTADRLA